MGPGIASILYAGAHPKRVTKLVLFSPRMMSSGSDSTAAESIRASFQLYSRSVATLFFPSGPPDAQRWFSRTVVDWTSAAQFEEFLRGTLDLSDTLAGLKLPVLVLHRKGPQVVPFAEIRTAASLMPGARLVTLDGDAGVPYLDYKQFLPTLHDFLGIASEEARPSAPAGGLRTVLFTDIVGHTEMMQRLGDQKGRDVLREHERITRDLLKQHGGAEVKTMGDGFMASFASVTAAMDCAIALQRAFAARDGEPLQVRVGLNAGEPIEEDGDLFGATVILASRIAAKAGPGEILIPEPLRHLLAGKSYAYADRGDTMLKGFDDAVRLYEVRWQPEHGGLSGG